jgi:hypothetical protein
LVPAANIDALVFVGDSCSSACETAEPCGKDEQRTRGNQGGGAIPRSEDYDDVASEAYCLDGARHHALDVAAKGGILLPAEVGEGDHEHRGNDGRREMQHEAEHQFVLPEEKERDDREDDIRPELERMNLVVENLLRKCHALSSTTFKPMPDRFVDVAPDSDILSSGGTRAASRLYPASAMRGGVSPGRWLHA